MMALRYRISIGVIWNFLEQLSRRGISALVTVLLAHFLAPSDFGLIAMMAVFIAVASTLMESGLKQALIRKEDVTQIDFSSVFYANIAFGGMAYALLFVAAPYIADFYDELRLIDLVRVTGLAIPINSLQIVQVAVLSRALDFKAQLKATVPASIISGGAAIVIAHLGLGVWALVAQMLLAALLTTIFLWSLRLWRPRLEFSLGAAKEMLDFGYKLLLAGLLDTVFKNIYVVIIAKLFDPATAGYYFFSHKIRELFVNQLVSSIQTVTYPALASIQSDNVRLKEGYRNVMKVTTFLLFPILLFMASLADPLFNALLPDTWLPAVVYLQFLCVAGLMYPLHVINLNILKIKGRSDLFLYLEIIKKIVIVVTLVVSIKFGIIGVLVGQIISTVLAYLPNSYFSARLVDYSPGEQAQDFLPSLCLSVIIAFVVFGSVELALFSPLLELVLYGSTAVAVYIVCAWFAGFKAYALTEMLVKERLKRM